MEVCCDLQVDVNGEQVFMVDKRILSLFSGRLRKLLDKSSTSTTKKLKVIFNDFPGGAYGFELIVRYCYHNGQINITPANFTILYCSAHFMEMNKSNSGTPNLVEQTKKTLEEISYWTCTEIFVALKQCQELYLIQNSSRVAKKCFDSLVERHMLASDSSPGRSTSSPDSSGFRLSYSTRSTESQVGWLFEDLIFLNPNFVEILIQCMMMWKLDHVFISKFLFYYRTFKFVDASLDDKRKITETVISMLHKLDLRFVRCKSLFGILRTALSLNIEKTCMNKLESMIGFHLSQATLDSLLVPSPIGSNYLYDVNLVLKFLKSFLRGGISQTISSTQLRTVASLMDSYLAEVAPDPGLKPSKFNALTTALPEAAREFDNGIYWAVNMYLEVHAGLSEEEKTKICSAVHFDKLSSEACAHLAQNTKFPPKSVVRALLSQQRKLKHLLEENSMPSIQLVDLPYSNFAKIGLKGKIDESNSNNNDDQIVLYANTPSTENLRANLHGMQWRVMELEKVCGKMQTQMAKIIKSKLGSTRSTSRSLPKMCS